MSKAVFSLLYSVWIDYSAIAVETLRKLKTAYLEPILCTKHHKPTTRSTNIQHQHYHEQ